MNNTQKINNIADGEEIANIIVEKYCNNNIPGYGQFINSLLKEKPAAQYNFTVFCFMYFRRLIKTSWYCYFNNLSDLTTEIDGIWEKDFKYKKFRRQNIREQYEIDYTSGAEIEKMMIDYIKVSQGVYDSFMEKTVTFDREPQYNFVRLCAQWFKALNRKYPRSRGRHLKFIKKL